jgi:adenylate kinase
MIHEMVKVWLEEKMKDKKLIVLDGYPRTKKQAELFLNLLKSSTFTGSQFKVINLEISDEKIIERLENRFICSRCKKIYNYPCPACGGKLIRRTDDSREIVTDRLKIYAENVKPLMDFYKDSKTQLAGINSDGTPDTLIANFKKVLSCELLN